ncbi:TIGR04255 family protein [Paraburkholderia sp. SIMBA_055]
MTTKRLPKKLAKEPLIDVVCGINFESDGPADTLLPGLLMAKLTGKQLRFEALPAAQLPQAVRAVMPNLEAAPRVRVVLDEKFTVLIGVNWLGVACLMPYAGWDEFRAMIESVFDVLRSATFVRKIVRHSLKYADFIKSSNDIGHLARLNVDISVAGRSLSKQGSQSTQLRTEIVEPPFVHATTVVAPATATTAVGAPAHGTFVDVDTLRIQDFSVDEFLGQLRQLLDEIHSANKLFFFELLSDTGLQELEPQYD